MWKLPEVKGTFNSLNQVLKNLEEYDDKVGLELDQWQKEDLEIAKESVSKKIAYKQRMYVSGNEDKYALTLIDGYFNKGMTYVKEEQLMLALFKAEDLEEMLGYLNELEREGAKADIGQDIHLRDLVEGVSILTELEVNIKNSSVDMRVYKYDYLRDRLEKRVKKGLKHRGIKESDMLDTVPSYFANWLVNPSYILEDKKKRVLNNWYNHIGIKGGIDGVELEEAIDFYMKTVNYLYQRNIKGSKAMERITELVVDELYKAYNKGDLGMMGVKALLPKGVIIVIGGSSGEVMIRLYQDMSVYSSIKGTNQTKLYQKPYSRVTKKDINQLVEFLIDYEKGNLK